VGLEVTGTGGDGFRDDEDGRGGFGSDGDGRRWVSVFVPVQTSSLSIRHVREFCRNELKISSKFF